MAINLERECFFIAPIGENDSEIRKRSDGVRDLIVKEAAEALGLETRRADEFGEPGEITSQIVRHCLNARMCVADLTGGNPNVYYELSVRHGKMLPVVLIAEVGTKLPFDVGKSRVIFFDHTSLTSARKARDEVREQIGVALENGAAADNPISNGMRLAELQGGGGEEKALALVMERLERLTATTADIDRRLEKAEHREAIQRALQAHVTGNAPYVDSYTYLTDYARTRREELKENADAGLSPGAHANDEFVEDEQGDPAG